MRPPGPYDLVRMATDAIEVLDAAGIEQAHVVGASMGGVDRARSSASMYPDRVRSLVLACTACRHHPWRRELLAEWGELVTQQGMQAMTDDGMRWLIGPRLQRRFGVFVNVLARVLVQTKPLRSRPQVDAILAMPDDMRAELHTITAPTLVITGSQDTLTPLGDAEELAELIVGSRLYVLARRRARAHGRDTDAFNDAVLRFIDAVDDDSGCRPTRPAAWSARHRSRRRRGDARATS